MGIKSKIVCLILGLVIGVISVLSLALKNENFRTFTGINASDKAIINDQANQILELEKEKNQLLLDKANITNQLKTVTAQKNHYLNERNELVKTVDQLNSKINTLTEELGKTKDKLLSTESELEIAKNKLEVVTSYLKEKENLLAQKLTELEESIANGELQAEEIELKKQEILNLQNDINSLRSEKTNLEKTIELLTTEKTSLEKQVKSLTNEVSNLRDEITNYQTTISNFETEISNLENQIDSLNNELLVAKAKIEQLESLNYEYYAVKSNGVEITFYLGSDSDSTNITYSNLHSYSVLGTYIKQFYNGYYRLTLNEINEYSIYDLTGNYLATGNRDYYSYSSDTYKPNYEFKYVNSNGEEIGLDSLNDDTWYSYSIQNIEYEIINSTGLYDRLVTKCIATFLIK